MMTGQAPIWLILLAFVAALGPLVFFHELGHYLVARWLGIGAEVFSIGFGLSPFLLGSLRDRFGSYDIAMTGSVVFLGIAAVIVLGLRSPPPAHPG